MLTLIGNSTDSCRRTCVGSTHIISRSSVICSLNTTALKAAVERRIILKTLIQRDQRAITVLKAIVRKTKGTIIVRTVSIQKTTPVFHRMIHRNTIRVSSFFPKPIKRESPQTKNKGVFKRFSINSGKSKKEQREQNYFYIPFLLHRCLFNIFNYSFRHHISRFMILTYLNCKSLLHPLQGKHACEYMLRIHPVLKASVRSQKR